MEYLNNIVKAGGHFNVEVTCSGTGNEMHKNCQYELPKTGKGLAHIINIKKTYDPVVVPPGKKFKDTDRTRKGAEQDGKLMRDLFKQLGYTIFNENETSEKHHWTKQDLKRMVKDFRDECDVENPPKSIIISIGGHGEHGSIITSEAPDLILEHQSGEYCLNFDKCKVMLYKDIIQYFGTYLEENLNGSRFLSRIPKIFLVNACQTLPEKTPGSQTEQDAVYKTLKSPFDNTLLALSQVPGFYSYRNPISGSWFLHCVAFVFMKKAYTTDVFKMLEIVKEVLEHRVVPAWETVQYGQNPNIQN